MCGSSRRGIALLELLLALGVVGSAILAVGPAAGHIARTLTRGRSLMEGTAIATRALASASPVAPGICGAGASGQETGRLAVVDWVTVPAPGGLRFEARIQDLGRRFPAESLATTLRCTP